MSSRFSTLEILAWALPLAVAGALSAQIVAGRTTDHIRDLSRARDDLRAINGALLAPRPGDRPMPSTQDGLAALVADGSLPFLPHDPWGRPYQFRNPGTVSTYEIFSMGPDGRESADDVVGWNLYGGR